MFKMIQSLKPIITILSVFKNKKTIFQALIFFFSIAKSNFNYINKNYYLNFIIKVN